MGKKLARIYQIVEEKGGLPGRMKFAQKTGISMQQAAASRDSAALVKRFKKLASEILEIDIEDILKKAVPSTNMKKT